MDKGVEIMAGMTADAVYVLLGNEIVLLTEKIEQMGGWEPLEHKGTVQTAEDLPTDAKKGWMYNIATDSIYGAAGMNVVMTSEGWDPMGPIINLALYLTKEEAEKSYQPKGNYLSGTDSTLAEPGKAADAKTIGDKFTEMSADISKKLDKNQGSENSGKIAGINESGDIVPMFPVGVEYNEETNCLEFGSDQGMKLNQGIGLDSTLTKTGFAADAGVTGKEINSLKESISTKITKFYASSQGETHLADSDDGKIMDMMLYGKSEQKQYSGKNLFDVNDIGGPFPLSANADGWYIIEMSNAGSNIVYKNITTKPSNKLKPSTLYTIITETEYLEEALVCVSSTYPSNITEFKGQINTDIEIKKTGISKATATTVDDFSKSDTLLRTFVRIDPGKTAKAKFRISIVEGDATENSNWDFEPYTGGQPSPSPDYPQEIKSVVNPTVKVCGKNLLKATLESTTKKGITCTNNGDGTYTLNGTANGGNDSTVSFNVGHMTAKSGKYIVVGCPNGGSNEKYNLRIGKDNIPWGTYVNSDLGNGCLINVTDNTSITLNLMIKDGYTCNNVIFKPMIVDASLYPGTTYDDYEPYHEQTVTLPYDLYDVKVASGGNVTIGGQQYVSDYFDVERGKLVRMVQKRVFNGTEKWIMKSSGKYNYFVLMASDDSELQFILPNNENVRCNLFSPGTLNKNNVLRLGNSERIQIRCDEVNTVEEFKNMLSAKNAVCYFVLKTPSEIDLTPEEVQALKALATYYPTTNISVNSEQLDGYTVFNYPISMANGWNYVKQQLNDNRDYIYDMDLQSAEAYVNSEYAVALTELEV